MKNATLQLCYDEECKHISDLLFRVKSHLNGFTKYMAAIISQYAVEYRQYDGAELIQLSRFPHRIGTYPSTSLLIDNNKSYKHRLTNYAVSFTGSCHEFVWFTKLNEVLLPNHNDVLLTDHLHQQLKYDFDIIYNYDFLKKSNQSKLKSTDVKWIKYTKKFNYNIKQILDIRNAKQSQRERHKALMRLCKLPCNRKCADCKNFGPNLWASVSCGVFICIRCAGNHRCLGVHLSWIRHVTMDSWTVNQFNRFTNCANNEMFQRFCEKYNISGTPYDKYSHPKMDKWRFMIRNGHFEESDDDDDDDDDVDEWKDSKEEKMQPMEEKEAPKAAKIYEHLLSFGSNVIGGLFGGLFPVFTNDNEKDTDLLPALFAGKQYLTNKAYGKNERCAKDQKTDDNKTDILNDANIIEEKQPKTDPFQGIDILSGLDANDKDTNNEPLQHTIDAVCDLWFEH